jgi:hypothetical protein
MPFGNNTIPKLPTSIVFLSDRETLTYDLFSKFKENLKGLRNLKNSMTDKWVVNGKRLNMEPAAAR